MKEFLDFYTVRNNALLMADRILNEGFIPDIVYMLLRGGSGIGNVFIEFFRLSGCPVKTAAAVAESYAGVRQPGETFRLASLKRDSRVLLVDDIFDSGRTINCVADEIVKAGISRENLKIAVHDYKIKHFDPHQKTLEFHPDYYARQFEIFSEADDVWIHYLSHELEGLTKEEFRREYSSRYSELEAIEAKGLFR